MADTPETTGVTTPTDRSIRTESTVAAPRDAVWRAFTDPKLVALWWGRGHEVDVERWEPEIGGHWRLVEHAPEGTTGFEGRFRDVRAPEHMTWTFEWDGMPGYVSVQTVTFEELAGDATKIITDSLFFTTEERNGMLNSGMEQGMKDSYAALVRLLASMR